MSKIELDQIESLFENSNPETAVVMDDDIDDKDWPSKLKNDKIKVERNKRDTGWVVTKK